MSRKIEQKNSAVLSNLRSRLLILPMMTIILLLLADFFILINSHEDREIVRAFPKFQTVNLNGKIVTNEILSGKFTIICIWITNSDNCQDILEKLSNLSENIPNDVQIIGLVGDLKFNDDERKLTLAKEISSKFQNIPQLMANDDFYDLLSHIKSAPTTCFVDKNGNLAGQAVFGADIQLIRKELKRIIEADSPRVKSLKMIHEIIFTRN